MRLVVLLAQMSKNSRDNNYIDIDEDLIIRIGRQDMEAFEDLYYATEKALYAYCLSLTKHHEDALDAMHDTYLKIRASAHLYQPMGKPMAWIFTIARNLIYTSFTRESRYADLAEEDFSNMDQFAHLDKPEDRLVLQAALAVLSEEDAAIVLLHGAIGYKHKEISQLLGMPQNTVISKYNRSLKKLREYLEKEGYNE